MIFKNRFYGYPTTFSIDSRELKAKGYNLGGLKEGSRKRTTNNKRKPR